MPLLLCKSSFHHPASVHAESDGISENPYQATGGQSLIIDVDYTVSPDMINEITITKAGEEPSQNYKTPSVNEPGENLFNVGGQTGKLYITPRGGCSGLYLVTVPAGQQTHTYCLNVTQNSGGQGGNNRGQSTL